MARRIPFKKEKLEEKIRYEANEFLRREISDHRLELTTISRVELNSDSTSAKVFWDTYDPSKKSEALKAFTPALAGKFRSYLAAKLTSRVIPLISIHYDATFEAEAEIDGLLSKEKFNSSSNSGNEE